MFIRILFLLLIGTINSLMNGVFSVGLGAYSNYATPSANYYVTGAILGALFFIPIILNFMPVTIMFGGRAVAISLTSAVVWSQSIGGGIVGISNYLHYWSPLALTLLLVDYFIIFLRPLTLSLRIIINISLGHLLVEALVEDLRQITGLVYLVELLVYSIQTFVFMALVKSYLVK